MRNNVHISYLEVRSELLRQTTHGEERAVEGASKGQRQPPPQAMMIDARPSFLAMPFKVLKLSGRGTRSLGNRQASLTVDSRMTVGALSECSEKRDLRTFESIIKLVGLSTLHCQLALSLFMN